MILNQQAVVLRLDVIIIFGALTFRNINKSIYDWNKLVNKFHCMVNKFHCIARPIRRQFVCLIASLCCKIGTILWQNCEFMNHVKVIWNGKQLDTCLLLRLQVSTRTMPDKLIMCPLGNKKNCHRNKSSQENMIHQLTVSRLKCTFLLIANHHGNNFQPTTKLLPRYFPICALCKSHD